MLGDVRGGSDAHRGWIDHNGDGVQTYRGEDALWYSVYLAGVWIKILVAKTNGLYCLRSPLPVVRVADAAVPAIPAVAGGLADQLVALLEMDHAGAGAGNDPARLVAGDKGKGDVAPDAPDGLIVGGADAAGADADHHLAQAGRRSVESCGTAASTLSSRAPPTGEGRPPGARSQRTTYFFCAGTHTRKPTSLFHLPGTFPLRNAQRTYLS